MKHEDMTLQGFAAWLRNQPTNAAYLERLASKTCPIAKYSGRPTASFIYGMPIWASHFIDEFDRRQEPTQGVALEVLGTIEARFPTAPL